MTAITATMCSTAQRQGPETTQTGSDSVRRGHATGFMWGTCRAWSRWPVLAIVGAGDMFVWCHFCGPKKQATRHTIARISHRKPAVNLPFIGLFFCPVLFLISIQTVYLKNAVSHITEFSPCSVMSLESVAHLIHRFIPKLEVKQTPDKAVAPSQPLL